LISSIIEIDQVFIVSLGDKLRDVWLHLRSNQSTMAIVEVCNPVGTAGAPDPAHVFDKYYRAPGEYGRPELD